VWEWHASLCSLAREVRHGPHGAAKIKMPPNLSYTYGKQHTHIISVKPGAHTLHSTSGCVLSLSVTTP
jgi:hypothetical protein